MINAKMGTELMASEKCRKLVIYRKVNYDLKRTWYILNVCLNFVDKKQTTTNNLNIL